MSAATQIKSQVQVRLAIQKGPHAGQSFALTSDSFTIGRGPENEVILLNDSQISRQHVRIHVVGPDLEILNLSQNNALKIGQEVVQKWKLTNDTLFQIGESLIKINFDLGHSAAVSIRQPVAQTTALPSKPASSSLSLAGQKLPQNRTNSLASKPAMPPQQISRSQAMPAQGVPRGPVGMPGLSAAQKKLSDEDQKKKNFYIIAFVAIIAAIVFVMLPEPKKNSASKKSTLKYGDETLINLSSQEEKLLDQKRKELKAKLDSPTVQRVNENFVKGMRDFQLGNYSRAQEYFQVVLNLDPNHALARRHMYLSKIRFDEVLKSKLILGESYYQKHNFKMCEAQYQQVLDMLQGKNNDQNYQVAQVMSERCRLASEGVR